MILFARETNGDFNHQEHVAGKGYGGGVSAEMERRKASKFMDREALREAALSTKGILNLKCTRMVRRNQNCSH